MNYYATPNIVPDDIRIIRDMNPSQKEVQDRPIDCWPTWARDNLDVLVKYRLHCVRSVLNAKKPK